MSNTFPGLVKKVTKAAVPMNAIEIHPRPDEKEGRERENVEEGRS